jgi:hypothetical protein
MSINLTPAYPSPIERLVQLNAVDYLLLLLENDRVSEKTRSKAFDALMKMDKMDEILCLIQDSTVPPSVRVELCWHLIELEKFDTVLMILMEIIHDSGAGFQSQKRAVNTLSHLGQIRRLCNVALDRTINFNLRMEIVFLLERIQLFHDASQICLDLALDSSLEIEIRKQAINQLGKWPENIDTDIIKSLREIMSESIYSVIHDEIKRILGIAS